MTVFACLYLATLAATLGGMGSHRSEGVPAGVCVLVAP